MTKLKVRQSEILKKLIDEYTANGKPVSSKVLAGQLSVRLSTATIRNELSSLEKNGYLTHVFTSSGRVPTDLGYRYYVNNLLNTNKLSMDERSIIFHSFEDVKSDIIDILKNSTEIISNMMSCIGLAANKGREQNKIKHIDLIPLSLDLVLTVLIFEDGYISKQRVKVDNIDSDIMMLEKFLNENLTRLDMDEFKIRAGNLSSLLSKNKTFNQICHAIISSIDTQKEKGFYYKGANYLAEYPEFANSTRYKNLYALLENHDYLFQSLYEKLYSSPFLVSIGEENSDSLMKEFSLIVAGIKFRKDIIGAVGMLGPKRVNYNKAVASVCCVADNINNHLNN